MRKRLVLWTALFAAGLLMVLCRMEISRFVSDLTALLVGGGILASVSGVGILLELFRNKR